MCADLRQICVNLNTSEALAQICLFVVFALLHALAVVFTVTVVVVVVAFVACGGSKQKCTRNRVATGRMSIVYVRLHSTAVCKPSARLQTVEYSFVFVAVVVVTLVSPHWSTAHRLCGICSVSRIAFVALLLQSKLT